jgi:DNA-binding ferritin-like protein
VKTGSRDCCGSVICRIIVYEALDKYAKTIAEAAGQLAERINLLGGLSISDPSKFSGVAYTKFEGEDN